MRYSIVIPTHNRPQLLRRAVVSALAACSAAAESGAAEVVVVDDASRAPAAAALGDIRDARLRVVVNEDGRGAAAARNFGVAAAAGEVVFFLDDDDEMRAGYCARILSGPAAEADPDRVTASAGWGFAGVRLRLTGPDGSVTEHDQARRRWSGSGILPDRAPLRAKIGAASAGFWIRREIFLARGGFDPLQVVDEDTDLCCRLVISGHPPWYEAEPGTVVHRDYRPAAGDQPQLTSATEAERVAASYLRTYGKAEPLLPAFSEARWFLAARYIRRAVKLGLAGEAGAFCRSRRPFLFRLALSVYLLGKTLSLRLKAG